MRKERRESVSTLHPAPVATSLLMVAILLAGFVAYRQLPVSALPQVDYPTIQVVTFYPGASPDVMASVGHRAARAPVRPDARPQSDDLHQLLRRLRHHAAVRSRPRTSTSPSRKCRPPSTPRNLPARATCPTRRSTARSTRPTRPSSRSPSPPTPCRCRRSKTSPTPTWRRRSPSSPASGSSPSAAVRNLPFACRPIRPRSPPMASASKTCAPPSAPPTSTRPRATSKGRVRPITIGANDQILSSGDYKPIIVAYRTVRRCACPMWPTSSTASENTKQAAWMNDTPAVIVNIQRQPGANIIAVVDRIKRLSAAAQGSLPAVRQGHRS